MSLRTFVNVIKLILRNLDNTKFFDGIPYNMLINSINAFYSTVWVPKWSSIILCQFEAHRSDALPMSIWGTSERRFTVNDTIWKTRNLPQNIPRNFSKVLKLILNVSKWSKHTPVWVWGIPEMWLSSLDASWKTQNFWRNSAEFAQKFH